MTSLDSCGHHVGIFVMENHINLVFNSEASQNHLGQDLIQLEQDWHLPREKGEVFQLMGFTQGNK